MNVHSVYPDSSATSVILAEALRKPRKRKIASQTKVCQVLNQMHPINCTVSGCMVTFKTYRKLRKHLLVAHQQGVLPCSASSDTASDTIQQHQSTSIWPCPLCPLSLDVTFSQSDDLLAHHFDTHKTVFFRCAYQEQGCTFIATVRDCLYSHFTNCPFGWPTFWSEETVNDSQTLVESDKYQIQSIKCLIKDCPVYFLNGKDESIENKDFRPRSYGKRKLSLSNDQLVEHLKVDHRLSGFFVCLEDACKKSFSTIDTYLEHYQTDHSDLIMFQCASCLFQANNAENLFFHYLFNHQTGRFKCSAVECKTVKQTRASLLAHYDTEHCKSEYSNKLNL